MKWRSIIYLPRRRRGHSSRHTINVRSVRVICATHVLNNHRFMCMYIPPRLPRTTTVHRSHIIPRDDFIQRIFTPCYSGDISLISPCRLAALFSLLAVGALHDMTRPIYCPASREWMEIVQSLIFGTFGAFETSIESIEVCGLGQDVCMLSHIRQSRLLARYFHVGQSSSSARPTFS